MKKSSSRGRHRTAKKPILGRLRFSLFFYTLGFSLLILRLFQIQILEHKKFDSRATRQILGYSIQEDDRGVIRDRRGREMALSMPVYSLAANPSRVKNAYETAVALEAPLSMDAMNLYRLLTKNRGFVWLHRKMDPEQYHSIRSLHLPGLFYIREHKRFYPQKNIAANVLGFVGMDNEGLEGLERYFNNNLRASRAKYVYQKDSRGLALSREKVKDLEQFDDVDITLTLESHLQEYAENELQKTIQRYHAESGSVIMMVPSTGEILVMANYPTYNPNHISKSTASQRKNRSIANIYEPGSTFKMFIMSVALEQLKTYPDERFYCSGKIEVAGKTIKCHKAHGWLSAEEVIQKSCNVGMVKIAQRLRPQTLYAYLREFGFGQLTRITLPGESRGLLRKPSRWSALSESSMAFGQEISVNALQLLTAANSIANGGKWIEPVLVRKITSPESKVLFQTKPRWARRVISQTTAREVTRMLSLVTRAGGTGVRAAIPGWSVAGKTGTAQIAEAGGYGSKYMSSFVGWFPADRPAVSIYVVIRDPKRDTYGGIVAAPLFKKLGQETINYMNLTPPPTFVDHKPPQVNRLAVRRNNNNRKKSIITRKKAMEILYKRKRMPSLRGWTMREVHNLFYRSPVRLSLVGTGVVSVQRPLPGTSLKQLKSVWVRFQTPGNS